MTEPVGEWNDRPAGLGALLDGARADVPPPERLDRVRSRLEAELGVALVPVAAPTAGGTSNGIVPGALAVGAIAIVLWLLLRGPTSTPPEPPAPPAPAATTMAPSGPHAAEVDAVRPVEPEVAPAAAAEPALPEPGGAERRPRRVEPEPAPTAAIEATESDGSDPGSSLREEIALLERAMAARDAGDPARAREVLETHRTRFPGGVLRPERERLLRELDAPVAPAPAAPDPPSEP